MNNEIIDRIKNADLSKLTTERSEKVDFLAGMFSLTVFLGLMWIIFTGFIYGLLAVLVPIVTIVITALGTSYIIAINQVIAENEVDKHAIQ